MSIFDNFKKQADKAGDISEKVKDRVEDTSHRDQDQDQAGGMADQDQDIAIAKQRTGDLDRAARAEADRQA